MLRAAAIVDACYWCCYWCCCGDYRRTVSNWKRWLPWINNPGSSLLSSACRRTALAVYSPPESTQSASRHDTDLPLCHVPSDAALRLAVVFLRRFAAQKLSNVSTFHFFVILWLANNENIAIFSQLWDLEMIGTHEMTLSFQITIVEHMTIYISLPL